MAEGLYRARTEPVRAWKYTYDDIPPWWVANACTVVLGRMVLVRPSGREVVKIGEWIARGLDGSLAIYTPEEFERLFVKMEPKR